MLLLARAEFPPWAIIALGVFVVLFVCLGAAAAIVQLMRARASKQWPTAQGEITKSEVAEVYTGRRTLSPDIQYHFKVGKQERYGTKVSFHEVHGPFAEKLVKRYPAGTRVNVYYHPSNEDLCALEPGPSLLNYIVVAVVVSAALALVILGGWALIAHLQS